MNAIADRVLYSQDPAADAPRLREIPYNYTSFSDREIVIRLLGRAAVGRAEGAPRRAPHRSLGANALRGAGRHLGRRAQSLSAGRPDRQPEAPAAPHRGADASVARDREAAAGNAWHAATPIPSATSMSAELIALQRAPQCCASTARSATPWRSEQRPCACSRRATNEDNIAFDGFARVSHVTDATDWRVEYPFVVLFPDTEEETRSARRGLHRARAHDHPARRRHAATPAAPLPPHCARGGHQHREARCAFRRSSAFRSAPSGRPSRRSTAARVS